MSTFKKDLAKGLIVIDDGENPPLFRWPISKLEGYHMSTAGNQQFGNMSSRTNASLVKEGEFGAPKPRSGTKCYRFHIEQQHGDLQHSRAELYWGHGSNENVGEEWFGVSIFLPKDWGIDTRPIGLGFDFKWPDAVGPANLNLKLFGDELRVSHEPLQGTKESYYPVGKAVFGQWVDYAFRFKRSSTNGLIEFYINKIKKLVLTGPTSSADVSYCLFGPYKWQYSTPDGQGEGPGTYNGPITCYYDEIRIGNASATIDTISPAGTVTAPPVVTPPVVVPPVVQPPIVGNVFINCGGALSFPWIADKYFSGGSIYSGTMPIADSEVDVLYQSERWGNVTYNIPVKAGKHKVSLHFAEIYHTAVGKRTFDVKIEGKVVLNDYDIFKKAGANKAVIETFDVDVSADGVIDIQFVSKINNAKISAIQIESVVVVPPPVDNTIYVKSVVQGTETINGVSRVIGIITYMDNSKATVRKKG